MGYNMESGILFAYITTGIPVHLIKTLTLDNTLYIQRNITHERKKR